MARLPDLESLIHENLRQEFFDSDAPSPRPSFLTSSLPRTSAWILKVVQAAVAGRSASVEFQQTPCDTRCCYWPEGEWEVDALAQALESGQIGDPLLAALACLIQQGHHPFLLALPGAQQALFWTGQELRRVACQPDASLVLTVSHRRTVGYVSAPVSSIETARLNAQLLEELSTLAFTCPIALSVDRRRLDALQACKSHGYSSSNVPIRLGWIQSTAIPAMPIPPATWHGFQPQETLDPRLVPLLVTDPQLSSIAASCLLSIHVGVIQDGKKMRWTPQSRNCQFYWVLDGVVVADESLDFPPLAVSCAVFASAQGLPLHSPLELASSPLRDQRREQILRDFLPLIEDTKISLPALIDQGRGRTNLVASMVVGGGALLTLAVPLVGLVVVGTGGLLLFSAGAGEKQLQMQLQGQLQHLQEYWRARARLAVKEHEEADWTQTLPR